MAAKRQPVKSSAHRRAGSPYQADKSWHERLARWVKQLRRRFLEKGHETISLMIVPHSAGASILSIRISKFTILFILLLLLGLIAMGVTALADQSVSDPKIREMALHAEGRERVIERYARQGKVLGGVLDDAEDQLDKLARRMAGVDFEALLPRATDYGPQRPAAAATNSLPRLRALERLDATGRTVGEVAGYTERVSTLLRALHSVVRLRGGGMGGRPYHSSTPNLWPVAGGGVVTSPYGSRLNPFDGLFHPHTGVDIAMGHGAIIRAAAPGEVIEAMEVQGSYGRYVLLKHESGYLTRYAHLSTIEVFKGDLVWEGQMVGRMGNTGYSFGDHLHFEVIKDGQHMDPIPFLGNRTAF